MSKKEGVNFLFQNNIVKILGNDRVEGLELIKTDLVKKEGETREVPVNIDGSNYIIDVDYVVMALGGIVSDEMLTLGLTVNKWGNILVEEIRILDGIAILENVVNNSLFYSAIICYFFGEHAANCSDPVFNDDRTLDF